MVEYCPCKKRRPLAEYEEGATSIDALHPNASITMAARVRPGDGIVHPHVCYGTAKCTRLSCRLLKRNVRR